MMKLAFKDNRGLTLVELIVSITILAIIIIPLLNAFVIGANTELRSREYGDATSVAQNLSEQVQANDIDAILSDALTIDNGARYYTLSGGVYTPSVTATKSSDNNYYIGIQNYPYNGTNFDALITLSTSDAVNSSEVVVGNQMDALLNMAQADAAAVSALQAECGSLMEHGINDLSINNLTRSVSLNITKPAVDEDVYLVDAQFTYGGLITATAAGQSGTYSFSDVESSSASVNYVAPASSDSPIFSAFLFYDAYYKGGIAAEEVLINNLTGKDVNVFLINTHSVSMTTPFTIHYQRQNFSAGAPVNELVFTNLPSGRVTYRAYADITSYAEVPVTGYLVKTSPRDRKFSVNIRVFDGGTGFTGTPILNSGATKLN